MGADFKKAKSRLEDIEFYTSLFLGALCIVGVLGLSTLFLVIHIHISYYLVYL